MIGEREGAWLVCYWVGGEPIGRGTTRRIHIRNRQHEHKRNLELRIETKRTTSIVGAEVYEEWLLVPFVQWLGHRLFMSKTRVRFP